MKKGWRNQVCSASRREGSRAILITLLEYLKKLVIEETELLSSQGCPLTGQEAVGTSCFEGNSVWV